MTVTVIQVYGLPAPQGSKRGIPRKGGGVWLQDMSKGLDDWRSAVAAAAAKYTACWQYEGPTILDAVFRFPMPASRPKTAKTAGWCWKTTAPDLDKLLRSTGDALTHSGLIVDDRILQFGPVAKIEVWEDWTGATLTLRPAGTMRP